MNKRYCLIFLIIMCVSSVFAQELIQNGSFEDTIAGHPFKTTQDNFNDCDQWHSRTYLTSNNYPLHSPDWNWSGRKTFPNGFLGVSPHTGTKYIDAATGNFELFYQDVSALPAARYILSGWIRSDSNYTYLLEPFQQHGNKISVYLAKHEFEFKSEHSSSDEDDCASDYKTLKPNDVLTFDYQFDYQSLYDQQRWIPFEIPININDGGDKGWLGILYGGTDYPYCLSDVTENGDWLNFDDLSLRKASCYCPIEEWIQHVTYSSSVSPDPYYVPADGKIQASEKIKAGYDVGITNPSPGYVIVESGYKITYQAGNSIELLPGFDAKPGSIFNAQIGPCEYITTSLGLVTYPPYFYPRYTGTGINNHFGFISYGATDYVLHIYGRNGQQDINITGQISPDSGHGDTSRIIIDNSYWDGYGCDDSYEGFLSLSNCGYTQNFALATQPRCDENPLGKTNFNDSVISNIIFDVFPNPTSEKLNIYIQSSESLNVIDLNIFDGYGKMVKADSYITTLEKNISKTIDLSDLSDGIYQLQLNIAGKHITKRIIKIKP